MTYMEAISSDVVKWKEMTLRVIRKSTMNPGFIQVQKTTAQGFHGLFAVRPEDCSPTDKG